MSDIINIYCDESCHLEHDHQEVMVLGAIWCLKDKVVDIGNRIREIKIKHDIKPYAEIKWTKVSKSKCQFYMDIIDYFFDDDDLHFRALIVPEKTKLNHIYFKQTYDEWYYKMYFDLLKVIIEPTMRYRIYIDYKDTWANKKINKLHEILANEKYDFSRQIIERIQPVRSHEVILIQITDLLTGLISYINRGLSSNLAKKQLVERMIQRSGYSLTRTTLLRENKVNIFMWHPKEV